VNSSQAAYAATVDYNRIVELILAGDPGGKASLYSVFGRGLQFLAKRRSARHVDDCIEMTVAEVINYVQAGKLASPQHLLSLVRESLNRVLVIASKTSETWPLMTSPEVPESLKVRVLAAFRNLDQREIEALRRFYLCNQPQEQICREMKIGAARFEQTKAIARRMIAS